MGIYQLRKENRFESKKTPLGIKLKGVYFLFLIGDGVSLLYLFLRKAL